MARPGGNPALKKFQVQQKYDWNEPCSAKIDLRVPPTMKAALKSVQTKDISLQEFCRQAIADALKQKGIEVG